MSLDVRNNSALFKRAEQLRRWEESETNRQSTVPKNDKNRKIKFSSGCVFLAACMAGDKEEVLRLLQTGADIDTANVDGLTALHQACIDDDLEMVEFLVQQGSDVNRPDNEGWTPLHATASCGFVSIARYLIESGADLAAINSDAELAIDLAASSSMEDLLQRHTDEQEIDCDAARRSEETLMLSDAKKWLRSDASEADRPHTRTGATALHVASAKGYTKVLSLLLAVRADVDKQDNDGWTPLHAAAHWGQKEASQMLITALADMEVKNFAGQTPIDIAHPDIVRFLEDLKKTKRNKRRPASQRITDNMDNHIETPNKVIRVEVKESKDADEEKLTFLESISETDDSSDSDESESTESEHSTSISEPIVNDEKPKPPSEPAAPISKDKNINDEDAPWRSLRGRTQQESPPKIQVPDKDAQAADSDVILRRTQSFESDEKFYQKFRELQARIKANSCPVIPPVGCGGVNTTNNYIIQRSASLKDHIQLRKTQGTPPVSPTVPSTTPNSTQVRRSFVPPARDEESETQRKAHAKRVRETRRSTQGVTLDEIKSAEQLVKQKNMNNNNNSSNTENPSNLVNDRVPSTDIDSSDVPPAPSSPEPITITLNAPGLTKTNLINSNSDDEKISATYTIPSPLNKTTNCINDLITAENESKENDDESLTSITATINVTTKTNNKTDLEELTKTASPTVENNFIIDSNEILENNENQIEIIEQPPTVQKRIINVTPAVEVTLNRFSRDKRSLFDIDNASSLSLADKLRNEANKYNEVTKSTTDVTQNLENDNLINTKSEIKSDSTPSSPVQHQVTAERRPSWRLKFDAGNKFKLEDASSTTTGTITSVTDSIPTITATSNISASISQRRNNTQVTGNLTGSTVRPVSAPVISINPTETDKTKTTTVNEITLPLRRSPKNSEDKENDKENDSRSAQATQAVIQRRRRPKRRSTGVVHVDMDELDPDRQESSVNEDDKESGSESTVSRSRLGSSNSINSEKKKGETENGEILDYKALWEASQIENDKLKVQLKKRDEDLFSSKSALDRFTNATTKNSLSEIEKRERRALERKLSEMEEELKQLDALKTENQRLKDENGALIRVISKLSK